jgi:hypothetical protein
MPTDRRDFLGALVAMGIAGKGEHTGKGETMGKGERGTTSPGFPPSPSLPPSPVEALPWLAKIRGTHRAVFDNPRDDGTGLIRAWIWLNQCQSLLGAAADDCTAVVVLRHGAVTLAMNDAFWAQYELSLSGSTAERPNIPKRNPQMAAAMVDSMGMFPAPAKTFAQGLGLDTLLARGGIVLACEFAFWGVTQRVLNRDKSTEAEARDKALAHLVPGVSLVPSGFLALAVAQQHGCSFVTNA